MNIANMSPENISVLCFLVGVEEMSRVVNIIPEELSERLKNHLFDVDFFKNSQQLVTQNVFASNSQNQLEMPDAVLQVINQKQNQHFMENLRHQVDVSQYPSEHKIDFDNMSLSSNSSQDSLLQVCNSDNEEQHAKEPASEDKFATSISNIKIEDHQKMLNGKDQEQNVAKAEENEEEEMDEETRQRILNSQPQIRQISQEEKEKIIKEAIKGQKQIVLSEKYNIPYLVISKWLCYYKRNKKVPESINIQVKSQTLRKIKEMYLNGSSFQTINKTLRTSQALCDFAL